MQERFQVYLLKSCWFDVLCDTKLQKTTLRQEHSSYDATTLEAIEIKPQSRRYYFYFAFVAWKHCELGCPRMNIIQCHVFQYFLLSLHNWANCSHVGDALISIEPSHLHPALGLPSQHPEQEVRQGGDRDENWSNRIKSYQFQNKCSSAKKICYFL